MDRRSDDCQRPRTLDGFPDGIGVVFDDMVLVRGFEDLLKDRTRKTAIMAVAILQAFREDREGCRELLSFARGVGSEALLAEMDVQYQEATGRRIASLFTYEEYLQTEHWRGMAAQAKADAEFKCLFCGSARNLNAHHRTYENLGNEQPGDLIVLCNDCHARHHGKLPEPPKPEPRRDVRYDDG